MSAPQPVNLRIVGVQIDQDERGRPMVKYFVEDEDGDPVGVFHTPIKSRLSEVLLAHARRNRVC